MSLLDEKLLAANRKQTIAETDTFTEDRYRQMHRHFPSEAKTILDVGCNTGRGGMVLKDLNPGVELTGLDCVPERLDQLPAAVYANRFCCFSNDIPAEDGRFDVIVGGEFLEHVPPAQIDATLAEFFRVLRLRGRLLLTTPNPHYLKNKLKGLSVMLDPAHVTQHYPDCLAWRMRQIGFSSVRIHGSGKVTRWLGERFPFLPVYGSYLIQGDKW